MNKNAILFHSYGQPCCVNEMAENETVTTKKNQPSFPTYNADLLLVIRDPIGGIASHFFQSTPYFWKSNV